MDASVKRTPYPKDVEIDEHPLPHKAMMIDDVVARWKLKSVIDVGGCWRVNGGYAFRALQKGAERATILDGRITDITRKRARRFRNVSLLEGDLGDRSFVDQVPRHDAAIIFDVLLHQVAPDWDTFLELYAQKVDKALVIYNQDFMALRSFRLPDKGPEWYIANTPHAARDRVLDWYGKHSEVVPWLGRPWRDAQHFWQWGITRNDLIARAEELGFHLDWFQDHGPWSPDLTHIRLNGYLFRRVRAP